MDPARNPYRPGAGLRPPELAGRDLEIRELEVLLAQAEHGRPGPSLVLAGLRGVGKTVLLNEFATRGRTRGWAVTQLEARREGEWTAAAFRTLLASGVAAALREVTGSWGFGDRMRRAAGAVKSFTLGIGNVASVQVDVEALRGVGDSGNLELDLTELARTVAEAASERGVGVLVTIDEMQDLPLSLLAALGGAAHMSGQRDLPFYVIGAGLPNLPGRLAEAQSYAERLFSYRTIGPLAHDAAFDAVMLPGLQEMAAWDVNGAEMIVEASHGYPYFIQQFAKEAWNHASTMTIQREDAESGIAVGLTVLDEGLFRSRWARATPAERRYLIAMARDGEGPSQAGEVAARLGKNTNSLGPVRANLIAKGLVYAPEHGQIAFTVPGFADFIAREEPTEIADPIDGLRD